MLVSPVIPGAPCRVDVVTDPLWSAPRSAYRFRLHCGQYAAGNTPTLACGLPPPPSSCSSASRGHCSCISTAFRSRASLQNSSSAGHGKRSRRRRLFPADAEPDSARLCSFRGPGVLITRPRKEPPPAWKCLSLLFPRFPSVLLLNTPGH